MDVARYTRREWRRRGEFEEKSRRRREKERIKEKSERGT